MAESGHTVWPFQKATQRVDPIQHHLYLRLEKGGPHPSCLTLKYETLHARTLARTHAHARTRSAPTFNATCIS